MNIYSTSFGKYLPKTNIKVPTTIVYSIFPRSLAKVDAKHPSPPPSRVPIPRSNPLLNVAPGIICIDQTKF